jgi:PadR family transcriptional regulator, regulatory protein AphA
MSLRHAMLGLLAVEPATGYELTRRFDKSLSNAWHASHSQIYPELARLEHEGMVEVVAEGPRKSKTWALTAAGGDELRRWLVEVEPSRQQRSESALRAFLAPRLLEPADARIALERDLRHVVAQRELLEGIKRSVAGSDSPFEPAVDLGLRLSPVMEGWLRDQLDALPAPGED